MGPANPPTPPARAPNAATIVTMSYLAVFLTIAVVVAAATGASWLVNRYVSVETRRRHHEVGSPVFQQAGVMISVLLAFVFSEVWGEYRTAAMAINGECGALHGAAMLLHALPNDAGLATNRAIETYVRAVVNTEWPTMSHRESSPEAIGAFQQLLSQAANLRAAAPAQLATQGQIVSLLAEAHAQRETRIFQLDLGVPPLMWTMLIGISLMLVCCVIFAGLDNPGHMVLTAAFTACVVLVLVLVAVLDYPFEGALALSNADFARTLGDISVLARGSGAS